MKLTVIINFHHQEGLTEGSNSGPFDALTTRPQIHIKRSVKSKFWKGFSYDFSLYKVEDVI